AFPDGPGAGGLEARRLVPAREPLVVRPHEVAALAPRDRREVFLPRVGKQVTGTFLVKPKELAPSKHEDSAEDESLAAIRVRLRVGEGERAAPAASEDDPPIDPQVPAQLLRILDKIPRRVLAQLGMRCALPAPALVEEDDPPLPRIEVPALGGIRAAARASMQEHDGLAPGVAAFLEVDRVERRDAEAPGTIWLARGEESSHRPRPPSLGHFGQNGSRLRPPDVDPVCRGGTPWTSRVVTSRWWVHWCSALPGC